MFCTLRQNGQNNEAFTFETAPSPYSKKRESKFAKVACMACRMSKLKCSGEPNGCQRCLAKKIECQFPTLSKTSANAQSKEPSSGIPSQSKRESDASATPPDDIISLDTSAHGKPENDGNFDFELPTLNALEDSDALIFNAAFSSPETWYQPAEYTVQADQSQPPRRIMHWTTDDSVSNMWASFENTPSSPFDPETSEFCYTCLAQAIQTHERVETAIWAQRKMVNDTNAVLQEQKKAIITCEDLLSCPKCSARPPYIMLLLSICSTILRTLEAICFSTPVRYEANKESKSHNDRTHLNTKWSDQRGDVKSDGGLYRQPFHGVVRRKGHLDDEDELLVLQSLVKARVSKMDGLLDKLDVVAMAHNWAAQQGLAWELKGRLTKIAQYVKEKSG